MLKVYEVEMSPYPSLWVLAQSDTVAIVAGVDIAKRNHPEVEIARAKAREVDVYEALIYQQRIYDATLKPYGRYLWDRKIVKSIRRRKKDITSDVHAVVAQ